LLKEENNVGAVQHPDEVKTANIAPYPLKNFPRQSNGRKCSSSVSAPNHPVLNYPNKITSTDFEGGPNKDCIIQMNLIKPSTLFCRHDQGESPEHY
jgi:hypothetical protein